jgi:parallel beta-helix repeat protein
VSGTASDAGKGDEGISSVTVNGVAANNGTVSGSGTANWNLQVALNQGVNLITVVAKDNSPNHNASQQQVTVNYQPATTTCSIGNLQGTINGTQPGNVITVAGSCSGNIVIRNDLQRIVLDGGGTAVIQAADPNSPALSIRGKGVTVQGFTIIGGSVGIEVNRGSNAVINNNIIQNTDGHGIVVDQLGFAVITNNVITNNPGAGIWVSESSTARIGFNQETETVASLNTIQNNAIGVIVSNASSARIVGNNISNNTGDGIEVLRNSQADIASNAISGNGGDGIEIGEDSFIQLGEDTGSSIYNLPNSTVTNNSGFGINCTTGGVADGRQGTLSGASSATNFAASCLNSLIP